MTAKRKRRRPPVRRIAEPARPYVASTESKRAKLFWNGRSQAVRLPREFRFEGDEVTIRRLGDGVILEPVSRLGWPKGYWERLHTLAEGIDFPEIPPLPPGGTDVDLDAP